jgi:hypothetical protein
VPILIKEADLDKTKSMTSTGQSETSEDGKFELRFKDFKMIEMLGEGSFGQVFLV